MIGKTISHYKILEKIGEGGMGEVYKAEDTHLKRTVALKFLPANLTKDKEAKERFIKEAQTASALDHPNICTIHEINETIGGQMFIVMACYEGDTLKEKIESGPLDIDEVVGITAQILQGLDKAHAKGIVHRDIKPANVSVTSDGVVKILDFGLAKLAGQVRITKTGTTLGTVAFMSPEQAKGEEVDQRTDIWSMGVILYEMLSGQLPFKGDLDQAVLYSLLNEVPEPISDLCPGVPMELERIVNNCLEKKRENRYRSVTEMLADVLKLQREISGLSKISEPFFTIKKNKPVIYLSVFLAMITIAIAAFIFWPQKEEFPLVTVIIFDNRTNEERYNDIGEIAAEYITLELQQSEIFAVYPVIYFDAGDEKLQDVNRVKHLADQTGATRIISGRYFKQGEDLSFHAQLSDARGNLLNTISTTCIIDSPLVAIEEINQRVLGALTQEFNPVNSYKKWANKPPRYDALLEFYKGVKIGNGVRESLPHFIKASKLDPEFHFAKIQVAHLYANFAPYSKLDSVLSILSNCYSELSPYERSLYDHKRALFEGDLEKAYQNVKERAKFNFPSHLGLAQMAFLTNHLHESIEAYKKYGSIKIHASSSQSTQWLRGIRAPYHLLGEHKKELDAINLLCKKYPEYNNKIEVLRWKAEAFSALGRIDEVEALIDNFINLDPDGVYTLGTVMTVVALELRAHGFKEAADKMFVRVSDWYRSRRPENWRYSIFRTLYYTEQWQEAKVIMDSLVVKNPDKSNYSGWLGCIYARLSNREKALEISNELMNIDWIYPSEICDRLFWQARIAALLGDKEQAVQYLWDSYRKGRQYSMANHRDIDFESLKGYPPYEEFIKPKK